MAKLQYHTQILTPTAVSWAGGVLTIDFAAPHLLVAGHPITLEWQNIGQSINTTVASAPSGTQITVALVSQPSTLNLLVMIKFYQAGFTGAGVAVPVMHSLGKPCMVQSYVDGTGGASYTLQVSLDGTHWVDVATVTHTLVDEHTDFVVVDPVVNFVRANVTSVGAATRLVVMHSA